MMETWFALNQSAILKLKLNIFHCSILSSPSTISIVLFPIPHQALDLHQQKYNFWSSSKGRFHIIQCWRYLKLNKDCFNVAIVQFVSIVLPFVYFTNSRTFDPVSVFLLDKQSCLKLSISSLYFFFCIPQLYLWGLQFWWDFCVCDHFSNPTSEVVTFHLCGWCMLSVFDAGIHPSRTWVLGSFESVRWNACADQTLVYALIRKSFWGMESESMLTPREMSPLPENFPQDRTYNPASSRTASPTHYQRAIPEPSSGRFHDNTHWTFHFQTEFK